MRKTTFLSLLAGLCLTVAGAGLATAADESAEPSGPEAAEEILLNLLLRDEDMFRVADADTDGSLSPGEFLVAARAQFAKADADGDGRLSRHEAAELGCKSEGACAAVVLAAADANYDDRIGAEEFDGFSHRAFRLADRNSDGQISAAEAKG
jgi:hypothetical protein